MIKVHTHAKNSLPNTFFKNRSSKLVGKSVSMPSSPRYRWCSWWYTLKVPAKGIPTGRLAIMARALFAVRDLNTRLCVISCIARKRFWLQVPPTTYAVRRNFQLSGCHLRPIMCVAVSSWIATTVRTTSAVRGSGPKSFLTCESGECGYGDI